MSSSADVVVHGATSAGVCAAVAAPEAGIPSYAIGYRSIVPRRQECTNLLVPVCLSASHVAFSSIRMEVQYQMLGPAAGLAAATAARRGVAGPAVDVAALQDDLRASGQVLAV